MKRMYIISETLTIFKRVQEINHDKPGLDFDEHIKLGLSFVNNYEKNKLTVYVMSY